MPTATYARLLLKELDEVVGLIDRLLDVSGIRYDPGKVERLSQEIGVAIVAMVPDSTWEPLADEGRRRQRQAIDRWNRWIEKVRLMFAVDVEDSRRTVEAAAATASQWIDRSGVDHSIPRTIESARAVFPKRVQPLRQLLAPFQSEGPLVVVPDTNVLLRNQELASWSDTLDSNAFTVLLVPGVLAELDEHKVNHRVESVREKALKFAQRIKGWRNQGSLSTGVRVQGDVFVRVTAREPNFGQTLSWLDSSVTDDRIIASVLEWQRANPMTAVQLLSSDSIMLAKADEAGVPTGDIPDRT
jgi:hypothetical protein